jgi:hypothetical protein
MVESRGDWEPKLKALHAGGGKATETCGLRGAGSTLPWSVPRVLPLSLLFFSLSPFLPVSIFLFLSVLASLSDFGPRLPAASSTHLSQWPLSGSLLSLDCPQPAVVSDTNCLLLFSLNPHLGL